MDSSIRAIFHQHRLRCTAQRVALYEALRQSCAHPTAEELYRMVRAANPQAGLSRATVYNTLEALCAAGLARRFPTAQGCCRYDADPSEHLHFRNCDTSDLRDVPHDLGRELLENLPREVLSKIEHEMGVHIERVHIQLVGDDGSRDASSLPPSGRMGHPNTARASQDRSSDDR